MKNARNISLSYTPYYARLDRRWNTDPIVKSFESPYTTFMNNPISFADPSSLTGKNKVSGPIELNEVEFHSEAPGKASSESPLQLLHYWHLLLMD